jgi:hypothetical protein
MRNLDELIASIGGAAAPRQPEPLDHVDAAWRYLRGDWPPFEPPARLPPRKRLTIEWLWQVLWQEKPEVSTADELLQEAAAHDAQFPESHEARYRRAHPDWLSEKLAFLTECNSDCRWQRIEQLFGTAHWPGRSATERRRIEWLEAHEEAIRPVLEAAKAEHYRRYGIGSFWYRPGTNGEIPAWKRERWPADADRYKVPRGLCTRWTRPEDRATA